jgi:PIN domain nuclease of toxin-antitoxin system
LRLLLDTAAFLWAVEDSPRLSSTARQAIAHPANVLVFSAASAWEIAIKARQGGLVIPGDAGHFLREQVALWKLEQLHISIDHAAATSNLPGHHRDPFDRMLVAQCRVEGLTLVTNDPLIGRYDVPILW